MNKPNFLQATENRAGENTERVCSPLANMKKCCFCFSLKLGLNLIVLIEGFCGLLEVYIGYKMLPDGHFDVTPHGIEQLQHSPICCIVVGVVGCFIALLLAMGVILKSKKCLLFWLYCEAISTILFMLYSILIVSIPEVIVCDAISAALEAYFFVVVLAYYMQMPTHKLEVLYTTSSTQVS
ncbi:hypothetical protein KR093_003990 [Drosophila rubida]|uniref:Uncharacterized protein n=1 Tax=Drosophila rubida TaxID=30044 RepID=A0AAD4PKV3_9MUSC|nr:hypothetical protein KR093_003990 [Drosophila rubida]